MLNAYVYGQIKGDHPQVENRRDQAEMSLEALMRFFLTSGLETESGSCMALSLSRLFRGLVESLVMASPCMFIGDGVTGDNGLADTSTMGVSSAAAGREMRGADGAVFLTLVMTA